MKRILLLLGCGLLASSMALAQNQDSSNNSTAAAAQEQNPRPTTAKADSQAVIRGCLSGSTGNYTVTDQNGMQYQVTGDDATLRSMVGREVEITGLESSASGASGEEAATSSPNGVQASDVRAVSSSCKKPHSAGAASTPDSNNSVNPNGTAQSAEPPKDK